MKYQGKKLLLLGSNAGSKEIIDYAHRHGAYVIVADYNPPEKSFAKQLADDHILISTNDLDKLKEYVVANKVDGVLAGISEFNLVQTLRLAHLTGLPFYCTEEEWNKVENKDTFRSMCQKANVPSPATFHTGCITTAEDRKKFKYPLVLKPVDSCASRGVYICRDEKEYLANEKNACDFSASGHIIVEEYVEGVEFTAHYTVVDGNAELCVIDNRYPEKVNEGNVTTIPIARVYPSLFIDEYISVVDGPIKTLAENLGLKNCVFFVQGLYKPETKQFYVFEAGLRPAAEYPSRFTEDITGLDFTQILVDNALLGKVIDYEQGAETPYLKGRCCAILSYISSGGKIKSIEGVDEAKKAIKSIVDCEYRYHPGDTVPQTNTLQQIVIRFVMRADSRKALAEDIRRLNHLISITDEDGNDMIKKFNPDRLTDIY